MGSTNTPPFRLDMTKIEIESVLETLKRELRNAEEKMRAAESSVLRWRMLVANQAKAVEIFNAPLENLRNLSVPLIPSAATARRGCSGTNWPSVYSKLLMTVEDLRRPTQSDLIKQILELFPDKNDKAVYQSIRNNLRGGVIEMHLGKMYLPGQYHKTGGDDVV